MTNLDPKVLARNQKLMKKDEKEVKNETTEDRHIDVQVEVSQATKKIIF